MTDATLADLVRNAENNPGDSAAVAILANALAEVSGEQRIEVLRRWVRMRDDMGQWMSSLSYRHGGQRYVWKAMLDPRDRDRDSEDHFWRSLLSRAGQTLTETEIGHWYAFRIDREDRRPADRVAVERQFREMILMLRVVPMDGGRLPNGPEDD